MLTKEGISLVYEALQLFLESQYSRTYPFHNPLCRDAEIAIGEIKNHIAALEENATAQELALKAAKAMQQSETERADANERDAERYRWLRTADPDKIQDPELCEAVGNLPAEPTDVDEAIDQAMRHP